MKKLLFIMLIGFGAAMMVKHGQVTITPDNQLQVVGYTVPLPGAVQQSPLMGIVASLLPAPQSAGASAGGGVPPRPMMPVVTSASGTYDANGSTDAPAAGPATGASGFNAAAKALSGR